MKRVLSLGVVACLLLSATPPVQSQSAPTQLLQGTQLKLTLLTGLSSSIARDGDPFIATISEPVYFGGQLILPAGARVHGKVGTVERPKRLSLFRGQAYINLTFTAIEIEGREYPAQMSLISLQEIQAAGNTKTRKDVNIDEGVQVGAKTDIKKDVAIIGGATTGGTVVGAIFSHAIRGLGIGLAGGAVYVLAKKGKNVELPAQSTGMLVRLDNTVQLPAMVAQSTPTPTGQN